MLGNTEKGYKIIAWPSTEWYGEFDPKVLIIFSWFKQQSFPFENAHAELGEYWGILNISGFLCGGGRLLKWLPHPPHSYKLVNWSILTSLLNR